MMSPLLPNYLVQVVSSAVVAVLLWHYFRIYRQRYLKLWAVSFTALAVMLASTLTALLLRNFGQVPSDSSMLLVAWLTVSAGYLQVFALLTGVGVVLRWSRWLPSVRQLLIFTAVLGLLLVLPFATEPDASYARLALRYGLRYLVIGVGMLGAALLLLPLWQRSRLGLRLVSSCFLLFGLEHATLGGLNLAMYFGYGQQVLDQLVRLHGLLELLLYPCMGLGLVIWLLEQERSRAADAVQALRHVNRTDALTGLDNAAAMQAWSIPAVMASTGIAAAATGPTLSRTVLASVAIGLYRQGYAGPEQERDALLQRIADGLRAAQPAPLALARLSGDEFVGLWQLQAEPEPILTNLCRQLDNVISRAGVLGRFHAHVGWAELTPAIPVNAALPQARAALALALQEGRDPVCAFAPGMTERLHDRRQIESDVLQALARQEFQLHLQPIVDLASARVLSFEVLARWAHPERGLLPPAAFLDVLHQHQQIDALDLFCARQACALLHRQPALRDRDIALSINFSTQTLQRDDLASVMESLLREFPINPARLILEVTEYTAMASLEAGRATLLALRELGFGIAIDDFGTGYSSLTYLTNLPATAIKFDRAFVKELGRSHTALLVLQTLAPLCRRLGKRTVAEGVETTEQLQWIREAGFDSAQGYLFSPPLPVAEALQLAERGTVLQHAKAD